MYADREEVEGKRSIRDRLNGTAGTDSSCTRQVTGKRQRQDDKWEHDLYESDEPQLSKVKVGVQDLRLKLQRKGLQPATQGAKAPASGMRDLREKLSGIVNCQPSNSDKIKPKPATEAPRATRKNVVTQASAPAAKPAANAALRKKVQQKADVDGFLQSLGLEKYSITFQAEEVDMTALLHMTDEDLKILGIPMGPRKKILLALESKD